MSMYVMIYVVMDDSHIYFFQIIQTGYIITPIKYLFTCENLIPRAANRASFIAKVQNM